LSQVSCSDGGRVTPSARAYFLRRRESYSLHSGIFPQNQKNQARRRKRKRLAVNFQCVIGFAIRADKGNNTKGGFNKKLSKGLTFLREFVDPAACILPNGKD
jgi:hypothetical protein